MKLKARDQIHISALGPNALAPGQEFDVSDNIGKALVKRGLADEVEASADAPATTADEKADEPHQNKAEGAAPANKAQSKGKAKAS